MTNSTYVSLGEEFGDWLRSHKNFSDSTIASRLCNVAKIESAYGPLPRQWANDNFESVLHDLKYTRMDRRDNKPYTGKMPVDGDCYNGLATYRSALRLYSAFLMTLPPERAGYPFGEIGKRTVDALLTIAKQVIMKTCYTCSDVGSLIITPLKVQLENNLRDMGYTFHAEHRADHIGKSYDRYDLIGLPESDELPVIVVEADTHRSDQMSKKVVSRVALNAGRPMLYIPLLYPNDHENKDAERKECEKYIGYLRELFSIFTEPQKCILPFRLYKI